MYQNVSEIIQTNISEQSTYLNWDAKVDIRTVKTCNVKTLHKILMEPLDIFSETCGYVQISELGWIFRNLVKNASSEIISSHCEAWGRK